MYQVTEHHGSKEFELGEDGGIKNILTIHYVENSKIKTVITKNDLFVNIL